MRELFLHSVYAGTVLTLAAFFLGRYIHQKVKLAIANPLIIAFSVIISTLIFFDIDYADYERTSYVIHYFLTPATVCLAIPLYEKIPVLRKNAVAIFTAILVGAITNLVGIFVLSGLLHLPRVHYLSILPKSVTTAVSIGISAEIGGIVALTVVSTAITGNFGFAIVDWVFSLFKINDSVARGLALGNAAHAIGTARALEYGLTEGAMGALAIPLAGLFNVILAPFFAALL